MMTHAKGVRVQAFASPPSTRAPAVVMKVNSHRRRRPGEPPRQRRWSLLRVRDWRVATKLAAVLLLPATGFLVLAGLQLNRSVGTWQRPVPVAPCIKVGL